jgi:hypothetical protein
MLWNSDSRGGYACPVASEPTRSRISFAWPWTIPAPPSGGAINTRNSGGAGRASAVGGTEDGGLGE